MWWTKLDSTDGSITKSNEERSSKWYFYGTYEELLAWLPKVNGSADWTWLSSRNRSLGMEWAGEFFVIDSVRYSALDRFEYNVDIVARKTNKANSTEFRLNPKTSGDVPLGEKVETMYGHGTFTLTEEMTGYVKVPGTLRYDDTTDDSDSTWTQSRNCPFTVRPDRNETNKTFSTVTITITRYFEGNPINNGTYSLSFKGIKTVKIGKQTIKALVVGQDTEQVWDDDGDEYTKVSVTVMTAPANYEWNTDWEV